MFSGQTTNSPNLGLFRVCPPFCFPSSVKTHLSFFLSIQPSVFSLSNRSAYLMSSSFASADVEMYSIYFLVVVSSIKMPYNGLRLGEGGDFTTELSYEAHTSNLRKTVIRSTEPPLLPNRCYQLPFCLSEVFSLLNIH